MSDYIITDSFDPTKLYFVFYQGNHHTARNLSDNAIRAWRSMPYKAFSKWLKPLENAYGEVIRVSCNETPVTRLDDQTIRLGKLKINLSKEFSNV